jgi:hypothetical protein
MSNTRFTTSFDYADIINALQTFMRASDDFRDVNWDGSMAKTLLRVLSYNTQLQQVANGFLFNELSIDSATIQNNVNSIASGALGYMPQGIRAAVYYADVTVSVPVGTNNPPPYINIDRSSKFFAAKDGVALNFVADTSYTAPLSEDGLTYQFKGVKLIQGNWVSNSFVCQVSNNVESYVLPNKDIDVDYLSVAVTVPTALQSLAAYKRVRGVFDLGATNKSYFLSLNKAGNYALEFGDDKLARRIQYGEVVLVDSLQTLGSLGNNASNVSAVGSIGGFFDIKVVGNQEFSYGGDEAEDIETTRKIAPMAFSAQGSAVSSGDYVALTKELFSEADSVSSWGGEYDEPPKFGYQIVAVKPKNSKTLNDSQKQVLAGILQERCVGSISPIIKDPDYTYINLESNVVYAKNSTLLSEQSLRVKIDQSLKTYSKNVLEFFGGDYLHSNLTTFITAVDPSFTGNVTTVKFTKKFLPVLKATGTYTFNFGVPIRPNSVDVVNFKILDATYSTWDFHLIDDGNGSVFCQRVNPVLSSDTYTYPTAVGTVDYAGGIVVLNKFAPISVLGIEGMVALTITPDAQDPSLLSTRSSINVIDKTVISFTAR